MRERDGICGLFSGSNQTIVKLHWLSIELRIVHRKNVPLVSIFDLLAEDTLALFWTPSLPLCTIWKTIRFACCLFFCFVSKENLFSFLGFFLLLLLSFLILLCLL